MQGLQIDVVDSPLCLEAVKKLWKANAHTLGFFPDGAFQDAFAKGWILGATDRNTRFAGYLLYRLSKGVATIVHLCVAKELRGEGIARSLVERLIEVTGNCRGIARKCRRDFPASGLWPQLGFTLQGEVPGRGRHRKPLLCWWRDQKNADLFSDAAARLRESKVCAVIDANVLFDLMHEELEFESSSNALRADWLADTLELFITEEIFIEIDRNPDPVAKRKNRAFAATFPCLPCDTTRFDHVRGALRPLFGETMAEQDHSDLRQLAWAIAADSPFLVTRDAGLLGLAAT
jgi:GNAT superfamily N-acetyltransferase